MKKQRLALLIAFIMLFSMNLGTVSAYEPENNTINSSFVNNEHNENKIDTYTTTSPPIALSIKEETAQICKLNISTVLTNNKNKPISEITPISGTNNIFEASTDQANITQIKGTLSGVSESTELTIYDTTNKSYKVATTTGAAEPFALNFDLELKNPLKPFPITNGSSYLKFELKDKDINPEYYYLIINKEFKSKLGYPTEILLKDGKNPENILDDTLFNINEKIKSKAVVINDLKGGDSISAQVFRNIDPPKKPSDKTTRYFNLAQNRIRINEGEAIEFIASNERLGSWNSPALSLKKGINIIQVMSVYSPIQSFGDIEDTNSQFARTYFKSGIWESPIGSIYIINYEGDETPVEPGSDTSIAYIDAIQSITSSNLEGSMYTYNTYLNIDGSSTNHQIAMSKDTPIKNKTTQPFAMIALGIFTKDPAASYEILEDENKPILEKDPRNIPTKIYNGVYTMYADKDGKLQLVDEIKVKVTSADKKQSEIHTIKLSRASNEAGLTNLELVNASLDQAFDSAIQNYYVQPKGSEFTLKATVSQGASLKVNGKVVSLESNVGTINIPSSNKITKLEIIAEDKINSSFYYLITKNADGTIPYLAAGVSDETKALAQNMLDGYTSFAKNDKDFSGLAGYTSNANYWDMYMAVAADKNLLDGAYVYDLKNHQFKQATDYAAVILQLVMLGENPYDFNGRNYVAELKQNGSNHLFANDVWYLMAMKAVGEDCPSDIIQNVKNRALDIDKNSDMDTSAWCISALKGIIPDKDLIVCIEKIKDKQVKTGKYTGLFSPTQISESNGPNFYTIGCILSAINGVGIDAEKEFNVNGKTPLSVIKTDYQNEEGKFTASKTDKYFYASYVKDLIVALGSIKNGEDLFHSYSLTSEKYDSLVASAENMLKDTKGSKELQDSLKSALSEAINAKNSSSNNSLSGLGERYYKLYTSMAAIDSSMKANVKFGSPLDLFNKAIAPLPETASITISHEAAIKNACDVYENLSENYKGKIEKSLISKYRASQSALIKLKGGENTATTFEKILALPDAKIITLNDKSQIVAAKTLYEALNAEQKALIAWSGKTVVAKLTDAEAMLAKLEGNGGKPTADSCTVSFTLIGDSKHGESKHDKFEDWIPAKNFTFNAKTITVGEVFLRALNEAGFEHIGYEKNYISKINGPSGWLGEFDNGKNSGWMYTVNGTHPNIGLRDYIAKDGDVIVWHYTDNYTQEEGSEKWGNKPYAPEASVKDGSVSVNTEATAKTDANGKATANISASDLKDALEKITKSLQDSKEKNALGKLNLNVKADAKATLVQTSLPKEALSEIAKTKNTELTLNTPLGNLTLDTKALESLVKASGGSEVKITIGLADNSKLNDDMKKAVQTSLLDRPIYDLTISSNNQNITTFGDGKLIASVPYTLKENEKAENVVIYHVDETGKLNLIIDSKYIASEKRVEFTTTHLSYYAVGYNENTKKAEDTLNYNFSDIKDGAWYKEAVDYVLKEKLMSGLNANEFGPNKSMTRGMFVTVLGRMSGDLSFDNPDTVNSLSKKAETRFKDIKTRQYYAPYVAWATENNIASGLSENSFAPNEAITREQLAVLLHNYTKQNDKDRATVTENSIAGLNKFKDVSKISPWAKDSMQWAVEKGILAGYNEQLNPKALATRAELASILKKYSELP